MPTGKRASKSSFKPKFVFGIDLSKKFGRNFCPVIESVSDLAMMFDDLKHAEREVLVAGAIDCKCRLLFCDLLALGTSDYLTLRLGDVFCGAIRSAASAVFVVH